MYHLPAYLALERWVTGRRVVVVMPRGPEGPRRLRAAGARQVLVIGGDFPSEEGIDVRPGGPSLPLRDQSVDLIACIESFGDLNRRARDSMLADAHRALRPDGAFAAWIEQRSAPAFGRELAGSSTVDFWSLEEELTSRFAEVELVAQMPWQGFSLAPVVDENDARSTAVPTLSLREELLASVPEASHYVAVAYKSRSPHRAPECLFVPIEDGVAFLDGGDSGEVEELRDELDRLREELSLRAAKAAAAHGRVRELESQLESLHARVSEGNAEEVAELNEALAMAQSQLTAAQEREQQGREVLDELERERDELESELDRFRGEVEQHSGRINQGEGELRRLQEALGQAQEREEEAKQRRRSLETDLGILTRTSAEQEKALTRLSDQLEVEHKALENVRAAERKARERAEALNHEREELRRQVDVLLAEREGARALASRVEAQLEVAQRRLVENEEQFAIKLEEASRIAGEMEGMRSRLSEQERMLDQTRSRAEELTASAAQGAEQGRMLADVALDRDRLREELGQRARHAEELEAKMWELRDNLQREKIEAVRSAAESERLKEQVERSRNLEQQRAKDIEGLGRQLRESEMARAELSALVRAREEQVEQLTSETESLAGQTADVEALRLELDHRGQRLADVRAQLEQSRARDQRAQQIAERRERELADAGEQLRAMQRTVDDQATMAAGLQGELDVKALEVEELATRVTNLHEQLEEQREHLRRREEKNIQLQHALEEAAKAQHDLRRRLRQRENELDDVSSDSESSSHELLKLRRELDAAASANEQLEEALKRVDSDGSIFDLDDSQSDWPTEARAEVQRLKEALAAQAQRHARQLAASEGAERALHDSERERLHRLQLETGVRAREQEVMLSQLDSAEQRIWEMNDAVDRNAARFAASLAQLEKHKEKVDALLDELEVTRNLLLAEQARALEQERLLASERAKMARAGIGLDGFPMAMPDEIDDLFGDLEEPAKAANLTALDAVPSAFDPGPTRELQTGAPTGPIDDRSGTRGSRPLNADRAPKRVRMTVEAVDDEEWPDDEGS